ncbi:MAG: hypothetical protein WB987_11900 [Candidatus Acidiferrales bacterium]
MSLQPWQFRKALLLALSFATLLELATFGVPRPPAQNSSGTALPTAKDVVARYDRALGGEAALRRHTSSTMRGTMEIPSPTGTIRVPFVYYASAPYLRFEKIALPNNQGDGLSGFDGEIAWNFDPRSAPEILTGDERESAKRDADFYYQVDELTWFKSMETVGIEQYEGRRCYHLHGINNWGKSNDHFYEVDTGLLAGYEFDSSWRGGPGLIHQVFSDYYQVDGVLVPMKQVAKVRSKTQSDWTVLQVLIYTSATFNDVDPAIFTPPKAVRDLAASGRPHHDS